MSIKKFNFLPDASLLSAWGGAGQPFFALFSFDGRLTATPIPAEVAKAGSTGESALFLGDCALRFRGFSASQEVSSVSATADSPPSGIVNESYKSSPLAMEFHSGAAMVIEEVPDRESVAGAIRSLQTEMRAGRSYLVNYCSQTGVRLVDSPQTLFQRSTAPFTIWLEGEFICFSPEAFISVTGDSISTNPMKGTGGDLAKLLADEKEQAEHATVVDLLRNDLGKVASGVRIESYRFASRIERQTGPLFQTSTRISGRMPRDWRGRIGEWLPQLLPAGSISGAPKQETLQLIRQNESEPRGFFTGIAVLFDGENLQSAVLIRFLDLSEPQKKFRSGAGITIYSDPEAEYDEIMSKVYIPV